MNIAIIGSGGREHAFAYRLAQGPKVNQIDVIPGNPGMVYSSEKIKAFSVPINGDDFSELIHLLKERNIDLVIVGPEQPLAMGIVNQVEEQGITILGPSMKASQLESSKVFAKNFMKKYGIPTADFITVDNSDHAHDALEKWEVENKGIVIKASELAGGKGVVVTNDRDEAKQTIYDFLVNPECTVNTKELVFEKKLLGREVSAFALCDGQDYTILGYACDHKRLLDDDKGPNTGGMGCFTPIDWPSTEQKMFIEKNIIEKTLLGMQEEGIPYKGILFVGLMIDDNDINVIEYNVRFGDPEAQTILPVLEGDLSGLFLAAAKGKLGAFNNNIKIGRKTAIHVVMTSEGYPSIDGTPMNTGNLIELDERLLKSGVDAQTLVFFAGVKNDDNQTSKLVNSGGRVLGVTVLANDLSKAREKVYSEIKKINFDGAFYREDIGLKALN